ncbi:MAG: sugar ABC transporter ATP-binding protein [Bacteroidales bacterium]
MEQRVEFRQIRKSFGGVQALKDVSFSVAPGEIHALVGENGAGKSTLMKILSGALPKDAGEIRIGGEPVDIRSTHHSKSLGVGILYQEFSLVPDLTVAENIFLGHFRSGSAWMNRAKLQREASELIRSIGFDLDPSLPVHKLSIAHQQIVEIAKALSEEVQILLLDEPSAVLGSHEVQTLFRLLGDLKSRGVSIVYISHHLEEVFQIADRITVLRDGVSSQTLAASDTTKDELIRLMLGRSLEAMFPERREEPGAEVLRVEGVRAAGAEGPLSVSIRAGEIVGLAGLVGSGRTEFLRAVYSADPLKAGTIFLGDKPLRLRSPRDATRAGIGMVPEDRKRHGALLSLSIRKNITLASLAEVSDRLGFVRAGREKALVRDLMATWKVKAESGESPVSSLSGGNQQKVVLARWVHTKSKVLLIDEPTRGVDVGARVEIYALLRELAREGVAILLVSSETEELMGLCDRILVMRKGCIRGEVAKKDFQEEHILRLALGAP